MRIAMQTPLKVNMKSLIPTDVLLKFTEGKMRVALALRCSEHNESAQVKIENGKPFLDGFCCLPFEIQVKRSIQKH